MFRKKKDQLFEETDDILVVFDDEQKTSDISRISELTEEAIIVTGKYKVPYHDAEITTGPEGRIFFYRAPSQSIIETKRLADLERNTIINQIANYRYDDNQGVDISKISMIIITVMAILMLGLSSCQG